jgi:hypothetical protein
MLVQPMNSGTLTTNGPTATIMWEGIADLNDVHRQAIVDAVSKLETVLSCLWTAVNSLSVTRKRDLVWGLHVGEDIAETIGNVIGLTMTFHRVNIEGSY